MTVSRNQSLLLVFVGFLAVIAIMNSFLATIHYIDNDQADHNNNLDDKKKSADTAVPLCESQKNNDVTDVVSAANEDLSVASSASSSIVFNATTTINASIKNATTTTTMKTSRKHTRVLVGFFSFGVTGQGRAFKRRMKYRSYFALMNDPRICPLSRLLYGEYKKGRRRYVPVNTDHCEFIYTFVTGFVESPNSTTLPTERLTEPISNEFAYHERRRSHPSDMDLTFLNIHENMNEGKSQTWFKYAAGIMDAYDMDYAIKTDTDTLIVMDLFFEFVQTYLPPGGKRTYAGVLADKAFWGGSNYGADGPSTLKYLRDRSWIQVYMAGQLYILSKDLVQWVPHKTFTNESWYEKVEDHDIGMRIYDYPEPIQTIRIKDDQRFWVHPAKDHKTWQLFMNRESNRKSGKVLFNIESPKLSNLMSKKMAVFGNLSTIP